MTFVMASRQGNEFFANGGSQQLCRRTHCGPRTDHMEETDKVLTRCPASNEQVAGVFDEMADLLEVEQANAFHVRGYRNAARAVRALSAELQDMAARGEELARLSGMGRDFAARAREIMEIGAQAALQKLREEVAACPGELLRVPGLGLNRVRILYRQLGVENLGQLQRAAREGRLRTLPGFGPKTEARILDAVSALRVAPRRFLRSLIGADAESLMAYLSDSAGVEKLVSAGGYRRARETVDGLEILAAADDAQRLVDRFTVYEKVDKVLSRSRTRGAVILRSALQVSLRVVAPESFGAAMHYFTGSKAHNVQIWRLGQKRGLKITEFGVFEGDRRIAGDTEESVFRSLGLPYIPPELREGRGEIEAAAAQRLPKLIERADLRGDLHNHTNASDGCAGLEEMALAARACGLDYLAVTDHSKHLAAANGLDRGALLKQIDAIDRLNGEIDGITILKGIEVDILEDGSLALPDEVLARLDLVVGSVHTRFQLSRKEQTERILRAMDRPYFSILAHPTGRLLTERAPVKVDMERIIRHARQRGCYLELNSQPKRLDLNDVYCQLAREEGVLISINSDSHTDQGFRNLGLGIDQARRGWLEKADVLNTRPLEELRTLLRETMG